MNWDAVGAVAELAGAAGVIITLAYLAVQMRQNARLVGASVANAARDSANELARILGTNGEAARIYRIGIENRASLSPDEITQFDSLCHLSLNGMQQRYRHGDSIADEAGYILSQSGYRQYWEIYSGVFPEDFRRVVAHLFDQQSPTRQDASESPRDSRIQQQNTTR